MKRIDVYRGLMKFVLSKTTGLTDEERQNQVLSIDNDSLIDIDYDFIKTKISNCDEASWIVDYCKLSKDRINDIDDVLDEACCEFKLIDTSTYKHVYNFEIERPEIVVVNMRRFCNPLSALDISCMAPIERISTSTQRDAFLSQVGQIANIDKTLIVYNPAIFPDFSDAEDKRIYNYTLLRYLDYAEKIEESNLNYTCSQIPLTPFTSGIEYYQYTDIYEILNEWNHATNLLDAFQKMYNVIEYMVYRKEVVRLVMLTDMKKSFMRQVKSLDSGFQKSERIHISKGFNELFTNSNINSLDLRPDNKDIKFCEQYFPRNERGNPYFTIANLSSSPGNVTGAFIYDVRCSIVHSKESEFHMTLLNYDEYAPIVELMKKTMDRVRVEISRIINDSSSKIKFNKAKFDLY